MKILLYEARHFSPNFHEFTGSKTIFAKTKSPFSPKIGWKKIVKSVSDYSKTKKKKKSGMDH